MIYNYYTIGSAAILATLFFGNLLVSYISRARFKKAHGCKPPPSLPQPETIIGLSAFRTQRKAWKEKRLMKLAVSRYGQMGPTWTVTVMGNTFINTIDPENIKTVLASNFKDYGLGMRLKAFGDLLGKGIFTSDGAHWEHSRALVRPNFTRTQVADLNTFETHIQHMISKIPKNGETFDLEVLFFQLTLDSATEFLFGESVNSLTSPEGSEEQMFGANFDYAQSKLGTRSRFGKFLFLVRGDTSFEDACKNVHNFVDKIVHKALERVPPGDSEKRFENGTEPERYVFLDETVKATRDPQRLRDELLNILLAGRDTTASLLSHTFHVLARRPDIFQKLKAEVDELEGKLPDYETIKSMKYLKYLLTESLRLYPVVPGNARFANKDTVLPKGGGPDGQSPVFVKKDSIVGYNVWTMHRRKDIYGPDADEFRPERWAPEEGLRPGWGYLPFNGGPRICVGQQFALTEASYTIIRLLQTFGGIENRDPEPWTENLALTLAPMCVKVALIPR